MLGLTQTFRVVPDSIAAAVSFILQAGAWWVVHQRGGAAPSEIAESEQAVEPGETVTTFGTKEADSGVGQWFSDFFRPEPDTPKIPQNVKMAMDAANQANADWWRSHEAANASDPARAPRLDWRGRRPRALIARVFWSMMSFGLMGGSIITFLYPLIAQPENPHAITASIILCTGFAAMAVFTLRKTTPLRQPGFWRETIRPFLISVSLFGIGATTTAVAREWDHRDTGLEEACTLETDAQAIASTESEIEFLEAQNKAIRNAGLEPPLVDAFLLKGAKENAMRAKDHAEDMKKYLSIPSDYRSMRPSRHISDPKQKNLACLQDEERTAVMGGLVMSSISFLGLTFFTGRNPRRKDGAAQAV